MLQPQMIHTFEETAKYLFIPTNEVEYEQLQTLLDEITDLVRDDETHPLINLMDVLGVLIEAYEFDNLEPPLSHPIAVLKHFMEEHHLEVKDLPELGNEQEALSILNRQKELDLKQIKALSLRFKVPVTVFI